MKASRFPDALVLIFCMVVLASVASRFIPPGSYEREPDPQNPKREKVVAGSFSYDEADPAAAEESVPEQIVDIVTAPFLAVPKGLTDGDAVGIIMLVFIVGGIVAVLREAKAIDAMIGGALRKLGSRPVLLVGGMLVLFSAGSSTIGMAEEYMPFVPILTAMCLALKLDAIVALGIVYVGAGVGYACAVFNPFTLVIARNVAGLKPALNGDEMAFRIGLNILMIVIGAHHILRYAKKVREDPSKSLVKHVDYSEGFELPTDTRMTPRRGLILAAAVGMIAFFIWGAKVHGWYLTRLSALFIALGLFAAIVARISPNRTARSFCKGAAEMTTTALLIGVAKAIEVVLSEEGVTDTIVHGIASLLPRGEGTEWVAGTGMLAMQSICNFFIPSGSGQAYVTMPLMAPLAVETGAGRETAVLAYQFGDGLMNMIVPTNALLMGMLVLGRIPYMQWLRFIGPLLLKLLAVAVVAIIVAAQMRLGS